MLYLTLMCALSLSAADTTSASTPPVTSCLDDVACLRRKLLETDEALANANRQVALLTVRLQLAEQRADIFQQQASALHGAQLEAIAALKPPPWYTHPGFLIPVGVLLGAGATVGIAWALPRG
jgi:hypothetical protein